jgi:hypothetical protein
LLRPAGCILAKTIGGDAPSLTGLTSEQMVACDRGCTTEASGDSNQRSLPVLIVHGAGDQTVSASESYLLAASHSGDDCRLLLCSEDDHRLITLCRCEILTGMLVDLMCGIVGTMDDPVSGKPSHVGEWRGFVTVPRCRIPSAKQELLQSLASFVEWWLGIVGGSVY